MSQKAKRFYKAVSVEQSDTGWLVKLDGFTLKTPGKKILLCPHKHFADQVAAEWDAQGSTIAPHTMPCTRLLNVAIERTPEHRETLTTEIYAYAGTDLLCYREDQLRKLTERQAEYWDPILEWAKDTHDITLDVTEGLTVLPQDEDSLQRVQDYAAALNDIELTLMAHFTASFGSAILAMAVMDRHISPQTGLALSRLDELYQIEMWGQDEEAQERSTAIETEISALAKLLEIAP